VQVLGRLDQLPGQLSLGTTLIMQKFLVKMNAAAPV